MRFDCVGHGHCAVGWAGEEVSSWVAIHAPFPSLVVCGFRAPGDCWERMLRVHGVERCCCWIFVVFCAGGG